MPAGLRLAVWLVAACIALPAPAQRIETTPEPPPPGPRAQVFDLPELARGIALARRLAAADRWQEVGSIAATLARRFDDLAALQVLLAEAAARGGEIGVARDAAMRAVRLGLANPARLLAVPALAPLAGDAELTALIERAVEAPFPPPRPDYLAPATPAAAVDLVAEVTADNTDWDAEHDMLRARFLIPPALARRPVSDYRLPKEIGARLDALYVRGRAAGNAGDLYDNRDRGHSAFWGRKLAQLTYIRYSEAAKARRLDYGPNTQILFDRPTFGNSSTALTTGIFWRSQARQLLTQPDGPAALVTQYSQNHIYLYPEHKDHDPVRGDLFPANTPYMIVSQGSSGSDRPFVQAVGVILAALPPPVKALAERERLIAPTVQMILRRGLAPDPGDAGYLAGEAHPSVFDGGRIDLDRLITLAQGLTPETLPGMVRLDVLAEDRPREGVETFGAGLSQRLFDTPSAIARIHRTTARTLRLRIDAGATRDPNGRPLSFEWRVLRGDATRIEITPRDAAGRVVDIAVPWHAPHPVPGRPDLGTHRVDIGVFAHNGAGYSAPAFVSIAHPPEQTRHYAPDGRVLSIAYRQADGRSLYADPRLFVHRGWTDSYDYDADGRLLGWTRTHDKGQMQESFTADGLRVLAQDDAGRPARAETIRYRRKTWESGRVSVEAEPAGTQVIYRYDGPQDRRGVPVAAD